MSPAHPRSRGENELIGKSFQFIQGSSPLTRGKLSRVACGRGVDGLIPAHAGKTPPCVVITEATPAHPRSRGENRAAVALRSGMTGSSPLTRGKPGWALSRVSMVGLIPAHAGKTRHPLVVAGTSPAHPRSRGENSLLLSAPCGASGSSPLTRGKHRPVKDVITLTRLIPAHAGKTSSSRTRPGTAWAHPRSRGENGRLHGLDEEGAGSSPLTRGKPGRRGVPRPP